MEITIKVLQVLAPQSFVSKKDGSEIVKYTFIGETQGQFPKKIAFSVMGTEKFNNMHLVIGGTFNVSFDVESREWQGKWFTEASAWRAMCVDGVQQPQQSAQAPQSPVPNAQPAPPQVPQATSGNGNGSDDLPF